MLNKKYFLSIALISLTSIGLISYFTVYQINSLRKLNESANDLSDIREPISFIDLNDKNKMEEIYQKIRFYQSIEKPIRHISIIDFEEEVKNEQKRLRNLETANIFEDVRIIDPTKDSYYSIMRWIAGTARQSSSTIILYPYYFNYTFKIQNETEDNITEVIDILREYKHGAFISLNASDLARFNNIGNNTNGTLSTKKARAVFNADFAILNVEYPKDYNNDEAFQDGIDWSTYFQSYYGKGTTFSTYQEFLKYKTTYPTNTYATRINETEVINGNLLNGGIPRFGFLIIPDYILGTEEIIKSKLGEKGIKNIVDYFNKGGKIIANGKSGTLLEDFGLMTKGVYDRTKLLSINNANRLVKTVGCKYPFNVYKENSNDFEQQMIFMSNINNRAITLASSFKSVKNDPSYSTLISLDSNNKDLITTDVEDGLSFNLTDDGKKYNPLILYKRNNKNGQIYVMNYNPVHAGGDRQILLNIIALALSKDLYMTSKVNININSDSDIKDDLPIPAGEAGFQLEVNIIIHNLNDKQMTNSKLYLFMPDNFGWTTTPSGCTEKAYVESEIPNNIRQKKTLENKNNYYLCNLKNITAYQKLIFKITISILNYKATQAKYQVLILEPVLSYYDTGNQENILADQIKANCLAAPLLRAALNPDPSSYYPLPGRGYYVDNVLKVENKEESKAYEVEYYGLIPLISPVVDGVDQRKTQWNLKIYTDYYY